MEGRELAEALQSGTQRLAGFLNQSVGKRCYHFLLFSTAERHMMHLHLSFFNISTCHLVMHTACLLGCPFPDCYVQTSHELQSEGGQQRNTDVVCCTGSSATSKLADLILKLSPPAAADMLASMLTRDTAFRQLVLEAVDNNERMRLVVGLLQQACCYVIICLCCCLSAFDANFFWLTEARQGATFSAPVAADSAEFQSR